MYNMINQIDIRKILTRVERVVCEYKKKKEFIIVLHHYEIIQFYVLKTYLLKLVYN